MSDLALGVLAIYPIGAVAWFLCFFEGWYRRRKDSYGVVADRVWYARMVLLTPVWLVFLLFAAWCLAAERWRPAAVGELIADFALDVMGRGGDE